MLARRTDQPHRRVSLVTVVMLRVWALLPGIQEERGESPELITPEKVFQAQAIETRLCFFAPAASGRSEPLINGGSGFPF